MSNPDGEILPGDPRFQPRLKSQYVLDLGKPDDADCGRGVQETLDVIAALESSGIPCCVVDTKALVYYGARRIPMNWEICVPTESLDGAITLLTSPPLNEKYEVWHRVLPRPQTLMHTYPRFTLKGVNFFFIIVPEFECLLSPSPDQCERSVSGIPYPKLELFAQSLIDLQQYADLDDLVDGMNLEEEWGETNLELDKPPPLEHIREKNDMIARSLPEDMRDVTPLALLSERTRPARDAWRRSVSTKNRRINDELPRHRYLTRFRKVGSKGPRENTDREV
ncbi:hypothetical protein QC762_300980 [Podospora pseudocomata]|uniref:HNH nuclease domain-containing protein n=1 Tax=Podospora pseudocomata TaxID=2093779 RepID=A0ABR0G2L2_9PEZI|nr:hypothetical protein QC762_300980 [Podospora pseudocomata]